MPQLTPVLLILAATSTSADAQQAPPALTSLDDDHGLHDQRAAYNREAIRFSDIAIVSGDGSHVTTTLASVAYRGDRRLSVTEFFDAVERPDLAQRYDRRRHFGIGGMIVGGTAVLGGTLLLVTKGISRREDQFCSPLDPAYEQCRAAEQMRSDDANRAANTWLKISIGVAGAGVVLGVVGAYYVARASPVSEQEAHELADAHNAKLRMRHGLPTASRSPMTFENVALVPYAAPDGGGFALTGQF